jgi:hypothetical protein
VASSETYLATSQIVYRQVDQDEHVVLTDIPIVATILLDCIKKSGVGSLIPLMSLANNCVTHTIQGGAVCLVGA